MEPQPPSARREHLHQRVWQLLPWYANGSLAAPERRTVEEHLAACRACREELAVCRELARAVTGLGEVAPSPHPVQLARLLSRIDAAEERPRPLAPRLLAAPRALRRGAATHLAATPRPVRTLLAAQLAAIALLGAVLAGLGAGSRPARPTASAAPAGPPLYRTLSEPAPARPPAGVAAGAQLRLVFAEAATEGEIRRVLESVRGQIVAGPSPLGTYTVEVPRGRGADPLEVVLAHLRTRREVSFAAAVAGSEDR